MGVLPGCKALEFMGELFRIINSRYLFIEQSMSRTYVITSDALNFVVNTVVIQYVLCLLRNLMHQTLVTHFWHFFKLADCPCFHFYYINFWTLRKKLGLCHFCLDFSKILRKSLEHRKNLEHSQIQKKSRQKRKSLNSFLCSSF